MTTDKDQNIWKWENTARITKTVMQAGFAIVLVALAATAIYTAAKGAALPLAFLAQPWVIAAIVSYVAVCFIATAISSYQQMMDGANGKDGVNGKDADFSVLFGDALKNGTIVEESDNLSLKLSANAYKALIGDKEIDKVALHVLSKDKSVEVKFVKDPNDNGNDKVRLTRVGNKDQLTDMKGELGMAADSKPLKVVVSNEDLEALKGKVATNLADVALENAISNAQKV